jgi:hypothetical protein
MSPPSMQTVQSWRGRTVIGRDGDRLGRIRHVYVDIGTGEPSWALVAVRRVRPRQVFVPLMEAAATGGQVRVPLPKGTVRSAPGVRPAAELSEEDATRLATHYGRERAEVAVRHGSARRAPARPGQRPGRRADRPADANTARPAGSMVPRRASGSGAGLVSALAAAAAMAVRGRRGSGRTGLAAALARRRRRQRLRGMRRQVTAGLRWAGPELWDRVPLPARPSRPRRRSSKMLGKLKLAVALGAGYVLGTRAGRERYEQIAEQARKLSNRPEVQNATGKVRERVTTGVERVTSRTGGRTQEARTSTAGDQETPSGQPLADLAPTAGYGQTGPSTGVDETFGTQPPRDEGRGQLG